MRDQDLYCPTHGLNIGRTICRFCSYGKNRENFAPTRAEAVPSAEERQIEQGQWMTMFLANL